MRDSRHACTRSPNGRADLGDQLAGAGARRQVPHTNVARRIACSQHRQRLTTASHISAAACRHPRDLLCDGLGVPRTHRRVPCSHLCSTADTCAQGWGTALRPSAGRCGPTRDELALVGVQHRAVDRRAGLVLPLAPPRPHVPHLRAVNQGSISSSARRSCQGALLTVLPLKQMRGDRTWAGEWLRVLPIAAQSLQPKQAW